MVFGKRRFRSLVSFRSLLELGFGAFLVLLWPFWGPLAALLHMVRSKTLVVRCVLQVFGVWGCVGGGWGVCLAWCRRFFVS